MQVGVIANGGLLRDLACGYCQLQARKVEDGVGHRYGSEKRDRSGPSPGFEHNRRCGLGRHDGQPAVVRHVGDGAQARVRHLKLPVLHQARQHGEHLLLRTHRHVHQQPHAGALDGDALLQHRQRLKGLLLGASLGVAGKVDVLECALQHGDRVRFARFGVDALIHQHARHVLEEVAVLQLPLFVRHLEFPLLQDDQADLLLVRRPKHLHQLLILGQDGLGDIGKYGRRLQHLVQVCLRSIAPVDNLVLITRDLKADAALLVAHHRDVGEALLTHWLEHCARHGAGRLRAAQLRAAGEGG
mmetsp:Transcript_16152/g.41073  ORF Transcript_16152/g.41073 Transcript_16152/m.41073 type:complete len:300 (+) Transcript_16152:639-1538(+)